jgi:hypothetical protein
MRIRVTRHARRRVHQRYGVAKDAVDERNGRPRGEYRRFVWTPDQRRAYLVGLDPDGTYVVATALPTSREA